MENREHASPFHQPELILAEARRLDWAEGLSDEILTEMSETAELVSFHAGETVRTLENGIASVYFIVTGRIRVIIQDTMGNVATQDSMTRGRALGLFALGLTDHSQLQAEVVEPTSAIRLELPDLLKLSRHSAFQLALIGLAANVIRRLCTAERTLPRPKVVGIVHQSNASRPLTSRLASRLSELGESVAVAGDEERSSVQAEIPYRPIFRDGRLIELGERNQLLTEWANKRRLLIDISAERGPEALERLLHFADTVLWCFQPDDLAEGLPLIQSLENRVPGWANDIQIVWILKNADSLAPYSPQLRASSAGDFKLCLDPPRPGKDGLLYQGVERIVHHLRGVKIGLALGGGAARGMAHLGVLKALQEQGIFVDMVAGTSAGAMTGTIYSAGLNPEYTVQCFKNDLKPSWLYRHLPAGGYWYLLSRYRRNQFDPMLRKYLFQHRMEQLLLPTFTISVDLVEGVLLVRDAGDATHNILESINLAPLALPIIREEQAVVDGGLLNNVPANVLVERGCNFVIASTVTAKIEKDFLGIRSRGRQSAGWMLPSLKVILRQNLIQHRSMNAVGVEPADFVIAPDVTSFDLSEFTRADEMAEIGESTTNSLASQLRKMLSNLDPQLFP
jgi:predicted acylesterase/phospholipase RssA/CRP-like cAMP-binding protein